MVENDQNPVAPSVYFVFFLLVVSIDEQERSHTNDATDENADRFRNGWQPIDDSQVPLFRCELRYFNKFQGESFDVMSQTDTRNIGKAISHGGSWKDTADE